MTPLCVLAGVTDSLIPLQMVKEFDNVVFTKEPGRVYGPGERLLKDLPVPLPRRP